ncbi:type I CRISPR-associated protein Cas7 [Clostridium aminobutyricum]|uniref:Type I CRISPR-associated protein Cas7 n=1 Tax=Clostridium aminobutyricum TaxID=33953 RepID=A0A939D5S8_CLOAM|nr:type I CRISPR-associated protein Cas7 [Clostridium aminobutyricum]MBN7771879.1 type I CRISPR-associated protein Cas7 [Clostridium aminobutyricum]
MDKRVYGVIGIASRMSNWNADFTGYPKTTSDGSIFGSDKALKYPIKVMWNQMGKNVLYLKSFKRQENKKGEMELLPRSLTERYDYLFERDDSQIKDKTQVLKNLFSAIDVKNFGATFAEKGNNISITGAVQIGQGMNKYGASSTLEQPILSPFRDDSVKENNKNEEKEDAKATTLGTKIVSDEAHYFYPFSINPSAYSEFIELGVTDGYTDEDYQNFKEISLVAATSFSTNAKIGCENEFAIFVETEADLYLPDLSQYIVFNKKDFIDEIQLGMDELLNDLKTGIKKVEIYYNPYTLKVVHEINNAKAYNIFTKKEIR